MINIITGASLVEMFSLETQIAIPVAVRITWVSLESLYRFEYLNKPSHGPLDFASIESFRHEIEDFPKSPSDDGFVAVRFASAESARSRVFVLYLRQQEFLAREQFSPSTLRVSQSLDRLHLAERDFMMSKKNEEAPRIVAMRLPEKLMSTKALATKDDSATDL